MIALLRHLPFDRFLLLVIEVVLVLLALVAIGALIGLWLHDDEEGP